MITSRLLAVFGDIPAHRLDCATRMFCVLLLLGLAVKSAVLAHWVLVGFLVALAGIIFVNLLALWRHSAARVPLSVLVAVLTATVILTTFYVGISGAIWMFPVLVGLRFAASPAQYQPARLVLIVMVPLVVLYHGDAGNAGRLLAAALISSAYLWLAEGEMVSLRAKLDRDEGRDPLTRAFSRASLEQDREMISRLAPVGLVVIRLDGVMALRNQGQDRQADKLIASVAREIIPILSTRERLYRLGNSEFMIGLAGWRAFESYELGQHICRSVQPTLPEGVNAQSGAAEVHDPEEFESALARAMAGLDTAPTGVAPFSPEVL
ncbi:GGDEF domain-containing protein [Tritonibacter sp. SIMBA_163]